MASFPTGKKRNVARFSVPRLWTSSGTLAIANDLAALWVFLVGSGGAGYSGAASSGGAAGGVLACRIDLKRMGRSPGGTTLANIVIGAAASGAGNTSSITLRNLVLSCTGGTQGQSGSVSSSGRAQIGGVDAYLPNTFEAAGLQFIPLLDFPSAPNNSGGAYQFFYCAPKSGGNVGVTTGNTHCFAAGGNSAAAGGTHAALTLPSWVLAAGIALGTPGTAVSGTGGGGAAGFNGSGGNGTSGAGSAAQNGSGYGSGGGSCATGTAGTGAPGVAVTMLERDIA